LELLTTSTQQNNKHLSPPLYVEMDAAMSRIGSTQALGAAYGVVDTSDDESETTADALAGVPRVNGVNGLNSVQVKVLEASDDGSVEESEDDEEWDIESVFEETLGEMDDQYLFEGGE
jgi:hypothetical protein